MNTTDVVYVVADGHNHVKIGKTRQLDTRLAQLQTGCPTRLTPILVLDRWEMLPPELRVPGDWDAGKAEAVLHARFAAVRAEGEWFKLTLADIAGLYQGAFRTSIGPGKVAAGGEPVRENSPQPHEQAVNRAELIRDRISDLLDSPEKYITRYDAFFKETLIVCEVVENFVNEGDLLFTFRGSFNEWDCDNYLVPGDGDKNEIWRDGGKNAKAKPGGFAFTEEILRIRDLHENIQWEEEYLHMTWLEEERLVQEQNNLDDPQERAYEEQLEYENPTTAQAAADAQTGGGA